MEENVIELTETEVSLSDEWVTVSFSEEYDYPVQEKVNEVEVITKQKTKNDEFITLHSQMWIEFVLNKNTLDVVAKIWEDEVPVDKVRMDKIKEHLSKVSKLSLKISKIKPIDSGWNMWDRVFLYWPTGTGKTHSVLTWLEEQKMLHDVVTVSDGFEDIDFLTYIFPSATGIQYKEKNIIGLFRKAAEWEKVAILIDEANRWSKSFMNFLLKAIDPVSWEYEINNFVNDEIIRIPIQNLIWFCTANLWGWYSGANDIDEALLDRFNKVSFVWYNEKFENELYKSFGEYGKDVKSIVEYIRQLHSDNVLKRPISSRSLKIWAEEFINTSKSKEDVFLSFSKTVMYRLVSVDSFGFPNKDTEWTILSKFIGLGFISK